MLESLQNLDWSILIGIQNFLRSGWADSFFPWITALNKQPIILFLILLYFFVEIKRRYLLSKTLMIFLFVIVAIGVSDFLGFHLIKETVQRPRPFETHPDLIPMVNAVGPSFISNHAANTATAAIFLSAFLGIFPTSLLFILTLSVGLSRIYCGVHYPSDVIGGWLWGALIGFLFLKLFKFTEAKIAKRKINSSAISKDSP